MSQPGDGRPRPKITADRLKDIGLFGGLPEDILQELAQELPAAHFEVGATVVEEGDKSREMFIVIGGELEIVKKGRGGQEARVALIGVGDWFGEMSILDVQPRSATVRTLAPSRVLRIGAADLDALYRHDTKAYSLIILNIARELSRRLRVADGLLAELLINVMGNYMDRRRPPAS
jgi:CRP-like cAMP-binding protein